MQVKTLIWRRVVQNLYVSCIVLQDWLNHKKLLYMIGKCCSLSCPAQGLVLVVCNDSSPCMAHYSNCVCRVVMNRYNEDTVVS